MAKLYAPLALAASVALVTSAGAYETDQLTGRDQILVDAVDIANEAMREAIGLALADTNRITRCQASEERTRHLFARTLYKLTASQATVPDRNGLRKLGFEALSAHLEQEAHALRFHDRIDIFGGVAFGDSAILSTVGTASTIAIRGRRIGTDKLDHFVHFGYLQARRSDWGEEPEKGRRWGIRTERGFFGLYTSKAFSFADLAANDAGAAFYTGLFEAGGPVRLEAGCVLRSDTPFEWGDHIDEDWDELYNPSVYTAPVQERIELHLRAQRDEYCAIYQEQLGGEAFDAALEERFAQPAPYADHPRVPDRTDPYELDELCTPPAGPSASTGG